MITYDIKTWRCEVCTYAQDFEPTQDNMTLHFNHDRKFKMNDMQKDECPRCAMLGTRGSKMKKETDTAKKSKHDICEQSDIDAKRAKLEAEPNKKHEHEDRDETAGEKTERIEKDIALMKPKTPEQIAAHRAQFEDK